MQDDEDEDSTFLKQLFQDTIRAALVAAIPVILSAMMSRFLPEETDHDHYHDDRL
ncbi:hypothetical protein [Ferrimonas sp. SCSIO 43195]|uniref:hypothetical protein n=1 Tax=Ferrimonas sp. SCSIO 43195 TaxID=2822844 RepID=UPI002075C8ED|nr:hypothetical protein [Ferrimonas sp. SCSIO 43195]USD35981.1 hypothetical protein J8Z22_13130 [Ferrimonas sp. SCSIO 43195]